MAGKLKLGLALGSGAARGWSHIGVIKALAEHGIHPDIVCGTSIGALVGASYIANNIDKLEQWVLSLTKLDIVRFFELNPSLNGFVNKDRLHSFLNKVICGDDALIEHFDKQFASVSTDLATGREIWHSHDSLIEAVWASIALPGLFPAFRNNGHWLVDGGLVNPVPVSVCRALGADIVIAVNLNGDVVGKHLDKNKKTENNGTRLKHKINDFVVEYTGDLFKQNKQQDEAPGLFDAIAGSINITQDRITRSRLAGDPPDILLSPKLADIGLLEFYRAEEAINEGVKAVDKMVAEIKHQLDLE
ncbi:MAG: patatin-like phospholipase RssA [Gammaproteobacteria bacterium]|nr:patatin-like phospholipase RssA [Gammaproteobacteria bacterium]